MTRFVLLATQRTGSTWLVEMLNSHPLATAYSELFLDSEQRRPHWGATDRLIFGAWWQDHPQLGHDAALAAYLDELWAPDGPDRAVGFKLMYTQVTAHSGLPKLLRARQARVVHLLRANPLRVLVSREAAVARDLFHASGDATVPTYRLRLPTDRLVERLAEIEAEAELGRRLAAAIADEPLVVEYDTLAGDAGRFDGVLAYLGLPPATLHAETQRLLPASSADVIENYPDVIAALNETRFERWLEPERGVAGR